MRDTRPFGHSLHQVLAQLCKCAQDDEDRVCATMENQDPLIFSKGGNSGILIVF